MQSVTRFSDGMSTDSMTAPESSFQVILRVPSEARKTASTAMASTLASSTSFSRSPFERSVISSNEETNRM